MAEYKGGAGEGSRAFSLQKEREKAKQLLEKEKDKIRKDYAVKDINNKFAVHYDSMNDKLVQDTVGYMTLEDFTRKREELQLQREREIADAAERKARENEERKENRKKRAKPTNLSFDLEEDGEGDGEDGESNSKEDQPIFKKKKLMKDPKVDTSYLPDREREEADRQLREKLRQEWIAEQERIKNEDIEITFSYWDGSGHRKNLICKKGHTIQDFLQMALQMLRKEFYDLRTAGVEQLMYIKEDLIIPAHYTFYHFIINKSRGKSGSLFSFDVHDDVRMVSDARVEKDESHAGEVVLRSWY
eukprot:Colp12_sorted_trinity150504_noHs@36008